MQLSIRPKSSASETLDCILGHAIKIGASDIHIDPERDCLTIRMRIDGILVHCLTISDSIHQELIARIKVLASLRPDIHLLAQDGRFSYRPMPSVDTNKNVMVDMRVSIIPTNYGENAVIRVLLGMERASNFLELGFSPDDQAVILNALASAEGMILVTGPTGSGKTSTMYAMLRAISEQPLSIVTLEDPIEYSMPRVRQIAVDHRHGINFGNGLRSLVRQDPDVIMVGEIRDIETAQVATNIALTGHLLISTLHTVDSIGAVTRLEDIGIDPYLVAHTLSVVVAQRLVRKICGMCDAQGCESCLYKGYKGRTVIAEVLEIDEEMRAYISSKMPAAEILRHARSRGMRTMRDHAHEKVEWGMTTIEEIKRVLDL
ncbi:MAG: type II/IV secretion system protein [Patescibacteria group bacterium]|nr:type II/IV secretion system protein [Patescibacteria group bacterium]